MKAHHRLALLAVTALLSIETARAYIPPSSFVIRTLAQKRVGLKGFKVKSTVFAMEGDRPSGPRFRETTTVDLQTGTLRSRAYAESGEELYVVERKFALGAEPDPSFKAALRMDRILFSGNSNALAKELEEVGEGARIKRFKNAIAWVFAPKVEEGQSASGETPELWVEKDTFLPLRYFSKVSGSFLEASFEGYRFYREYPYPRLIRLARGGSAFIQAELQEILVNPDLGEFRKPIGRAGATEEGNSASSDIRELLKSYYSLLR